MQQDKSSTGPFRTYLYDSMRARHSGDNAPIQWLNGALLPDAWWPVVLLFLTIHPHASPDRALPICDPVFAFSHLP